ncbi:MAG: RNA polymerase subunit sigma-24 [Chloroflexi bacterium]|nr:RNA polymerase subunit sigma-24 [Chloroflexota bacterium]MDL1882363.1 sigma-70 family RNA polymerase sigma factor [Anaerolineae bacterium CFX8]
MASRLENEPALIQAARRGDLEAFNTLVLHYQDGVYALVYRILGEPAAAADVAQEAFITAYRHLRDYRGGSFRAWVFRIATNACYDELRRRKRRPAMLFDDLPGAEVDDGPALPADSPTPEQAAQQAELNRAIERCIRALQPDQRLVLVLSDIEGLSYQEIADSAGLNLGTVKSRLSRARAGVRACLQAVQELLPPVYRLNSERE